VLSCPEAHATVATSSRRKGKWELDCLRRTIALGGGCVG
jgi:hypothetical protein